MIKAIVYTSNTGNTERYAKLLGHQLDLPVYALNDAKRTLERNTAVIYMGWIMAGRIKGYKNAEKEERTPDEDEMLDLMMNGGSRVSMENLFGPIQWYEQVRDLI